MLLQFFKPDNYFEVAQGPGTGRPHRSDRRLRRAHTGSLPNEAVHERRSLANDATIVDHDYVVAKAAKDEPAGERGLPNQDYRPGRNTVPAGSRLR